MVRTTLYSCNSSQTLWTNFTRKYRKPGIENPRLATNGSPLPDPRKISLTVFGKDNRFSLKYTSAVYLFGQFIAHDFSFTAENEYSNRLCTI